MTKLGRQIGASPVRAAAPEWPWQFQAAPAVGRFPSRQVTQKDRGRYAGIAGIALAGARGSRR